AVVTTFDGDAREQHQCACRPVGEVRPSGELEAPLELLEITFAHADRRECVGGDLRVAEALRELERALTPSDRLLRTDRGTAGRREVRVRHGELAARRKVFEQRDGVPGGSV